VVVNVKESLIGAWRLVTFEFHKADGRVIYPYGEQARGSIIYTTSGRYSAQLMRRDRPRFVIADQMKGTPQEIEASYKGSISYFGTYEVDEENRFIIHHVAGSIFPNMEGSSQKRSFELSGDRLQLTTQPINLDGERAEGVLLWEKIPE
jgi:hypothetical protein